MSRSGGSIRAAYFYDASLLAERNMRKLILLICGMMTVLLLSSCTPLPSKHHPVTNPNTRWVSENPDMFFEVGDFAEVGDLTAKVTYAQIIVDDKVIELILNFSYSGKSVFVYDTSARLPSGAIKGGELLFRGLCKSSVNKLIFTIDLNEKGFLDDSITEIVFVREELNE